MVNKKVGLAVVFALAAAGAFAQIQMSAGGGLLFDWNKSSIDLKDSGGNSFKINIKNNTILGAFGFFDATYAEINAAVVLGKVLMEAPTTGVGTAVLGSAWQLNLTLLGKYPFDLGRVTLFPLFGFSYNMVLSLAGSENNPTAYRAAAKDLSQFGLLGGAGIDFGLGEKLFIRGEALFQTRFASKYEKDLAGSWPGSTGKAGLGIGPVIKLGVGYKL